MITHPMVRIAYGFVLLVMAFVAPLWVTAVFAIFGVVLMDYYVEGAVIVMMVDVIARSDGTMGISGWAIVLAILLAESMRNRLWTEVD